MTEIQFVSTNAGKFREAAAILRPYGVRLRWRRRELPEPQAGTLEEVVRAKLDAARGLPGLVLVEDSGLFIPSLEGFPGVYSKHFFKLWGFGPILELLRRRGRRAYFKTVAGLASGNRRAFFSGTVQGVIARRPQGRGGFGYDPIFIPRGHARSFAELSVHEKNALSHRARALRKLGAALATGAALALSACSPWQKQADNLQGIISSLLANGQRGKPDFVAEFGPPASCAPRPTGELCQWKRRWGAAGPKEVADDIRVEFDLSGRFISGKALVHRGSRVYRGHAASRSRDSLL